jgi:hypothetical protein
MDKHKNLDEYLGLINTAITEMEGLINCSQEEFDNDMDSMVQRFQILLSELKKFQENVSAGSIVPGEYRGEELMQLAAKIQASLPVHLLVTEIDRIAREGFEG